MSAIGIIFRDDTLTLTAAKAWISQNSLSYDGSAMVETDTLSDAAWLAGLKTMAKVLTKAPDSTWTGLWKLSAADIADLAANLPVGRYTIYFFDASSTPAPGDGSWSHQEYEHGDSWIHDLYGFDTSSLTEDDMTRNSLYTVVQGCTEFRISEDTLTIYQTDGETVHDTFDVFKDGGADPVTGVS